MDSQKNKMDKLMKVLGIATNVGLAIIVLAMAFLFVYNLIRL